MMIHKFELETAMLQARADTYGSIAKLVALIPKDDYEKLKAVCDASVGVMDEYENNLKDYLGLKDDTEEEKWLKTNL